MNRSTPVLAFVATGCLLHPMAPPPPPVPASPAFTCTAPVVATGPTAPTATAARSLVVSLVSGEAPDWETAIPESTVAPSTASAPRSPQGSSGSAEPQLRQFQETTGLRAKTDADEPDVRAIRSQLLGTRQWRALWRLCLTASKRAKTMICSRNNA